MTDPGRDQKAARLADLRRLAGLLAPHSAGGDKPISIAISRMTPEDRAEAEAILERNPDLGEPPDKTEARREMLLDIAEWEATAQGIRDDPGTSPAIKRHAARTLADIARLRSRLTGLPYPDDSGSDAN